MNHRTLRRRAAAAAVASIGFIAAGAAAGVNAGAESPELGFTPITTNALSCAEAGYLKFANDPFGKAIVPKVLMSAGDAATPINAPATSNKVGSENDMIALSPDGKYLFTSSEAGASDGITRLTLKGPKKGTKELLAANIDTSVTPAKNGWSRIDGMNWYPFGGPGGLGVLLGGEEFSTTSTARGGGIWQINPDTGAFARLDWIGDFAHEGIAITADGTMYIGDEVRAGGIYKAVPNDPTDLTKGGSLYYLVPSSVDASGWKLVTNLADPGKQAIVDGVLFDRPEDFEALNGRVYFTVTEPRADADNRFPQPDHVVNRGGVYTFRATGVPELSAGDRTTRLTPMIEVNDPKYATQDEAKAQQGLQFPDNIAFDNEGNLWVHEDIPDGSATVFPSSGIDVSKQTRDQQDELYVFVLNKKGDAIKANPSTTGPAISGGYKAADMRTSPAATPCQNEFTGGIFKGDTLYINQQHAENSTLKIELD
jgi:secreted PhoX family phosphatase